MEREFVGVKRKKGVENEKVKQFQHLYLLIFLANKPELPYLLNPNWVKFKFVWD